MEIKCYDKENIKRKEQAYTPYMRSAMEDKSVCYYCGTIYDKELGKCPLCGSTVRSSQDEAARPQPRRRLTEQERRDRRRKSKGKFSKTKKSSKVSARPIMIAALIFLILAVLALGWFIFDMLGWLPGLEDNVERETPAIEAPDTSCTDLSLSAQQISFTEAGETKELIVQVNLHCNETVYVNSMDGAVVSVSMNAETKEEETCKSATFVLTAIAEGETEIRITCGAKEAICKVKCEFTTPIDPSGSSQPDPSETDPDDTDEPSETVDEDYLPEVNHEGDLTFSARGEKVTLRVTNLPAGETATWTSGDESVVKVNAYGEVTAIGGGKTKILVTVAGKTTELLVRCNFGDFIDQGAHLESGRSDVTVSVGESFKLYLYDSDGDRIEDVTYEISDSSVCKVEDGLVTATGYGTAEVTIVYYDMEFTCIVRVR